MSESKKMFLKSKRQVAVGLLVLFFLCCLRSEAEEKNAAGYPIPQPGYVFEFPRDHGSHPDFRIEWWYWVGHLFDSEGKRYGFQATFFRNRLKPPPEEDRHGMPVVLPAPGAFGDTHVYLAHMALVDPESGRYLFEERVNRDGWDANSSEETLDLRNGNWRVWVETTESGEERFVLRASVQSEIKLDLSFIPEKPRTIFGEQGISIKGDEIGASSYYISYTRLKASGNLILGEKRVAVEGQAWMDHEISSNQLGKDLAGWDWVCIQLLDGREIKAYRLRQKAGGISPHSRFIWIGKKGEVQSLRPFEFQWREDDFWRSPFHGSRYPTHVSVVAVDPATGEERTFTIKPIYPQQEIMGRGEGINYWEGACRVTDEAGAEIGSAYLELTGYDKPLNLSNE